MKFIFYRIHKFFLYLSGRSSANHHVVKIAGGIKKKKRAEKKCPHGKRKSCCPDCKGSQTCMHGRRKGECTECPIRPGSKISRNICKICVSKHLSTRRRLLGVCAECGTEKPPRVELIFGGMIAENVGFPPNGQDETFATSDKCKAFSKRRPDLIWLVPGKVAVVLEIDENSHQGYEGICEVGKISEQNMVLQLSDGCENIPVFTIRVNPDSYDKAVVTLKQRAVKVAEKVKEILSRAEYEQNAASKIYFAYYHSKSNHLIEEQRKYFDVEVLE